MCAGRVIYGYIKRSCRIKYRCSHARTHLRREKIFFSYSFIVAAVVAVVVVVVVETSKKIRKGANCYLYYSVKSSKPRGSTRYRRIPREPKQRKCNTHCVWVEKEGLEWISRINWLCQG